MYSKSICILMLFMIIFSTGCQELVNDPGEGGGYTESSDGINKWGGVYNDDGHSVVQTQDGGYAIIGSQFSTATQNDLILLKFTEDLSVEPTEKKWNSEFADSLYDNIANDLKQTNDGGYVMVGNSFNGTDFDVWVVKFSSLLEFEWEDTIQGGSHDRGNSIQQTQDGGYLVCGSKLKGSDWDMALWKITTDGTSAGTAHSIIWSGDSLTTQDSNNEPDYGHYAQQTSDGGYIIVGSSYTAANAKDIRLIKLDATGNNHATGGSGGFDSTYSIASGYYDDEGIFVQQTADNGYVVVGNYETAGWGQSQAFIFKTNYQGAEPSTKPTFGGAYPDMANCVRQTNDGGYVFVGNKYSSISTESDVWIVKLNYDLSTEWEYTFGGENDDFANSINQTNDGGYIITGTTNSETDGKQSEILVLELTGDGKAVVHTDD